MSKREKQVQHDEKTKEQMNIKSKTPSRVDLHGHKYKKKKKQSNIENDHNNHNDHNDENHEGKRKFKISIPLVLLIILLLLPITTIIVINKDKEATPVHNVGEEISWEDPADEESKVDREKPKKPEIKEEPKEEPSETPEPNDSQVDDGDKEEDLQTEEENSPEEEIVETPVVQEETQVETVKYHTVQSGETLYRISMNYYNDQSGIEKIKQANGLTGNELSVGQTLKIPLP
ncbi:LysM peptidoglycan-binding domain-containing protein [Lederbergia citrea]|uniref:LysM peptidoglycan-binding domain-containing protein n=1 Tax=Lederbergia citrea TaxID=2833581 RepID=UPI001BC8E506|nr:LysM peptidoglycan-binding domain-containing protein [Lederbergia citrea]MBS4176480.1 LysM peptidoglycan-binding domain-containing protein [Lederbergia citrea]MBS4203041.1 LysM peptidoglycan-binding domain-containing protein [Lederbergia citrea]